MPIPKPRKDEKHDDFMSRCMGDEVMNDDYPKNDQRYAVCQASWDDSKKKKNNGNNTMRSRNLFRIQHALYQQPWLIKPSVHQNLVDQFEKFISGQMPEDMPMDDEEDDMPMSPEDMPEDKPIETGTRIAVLSIDGIIGKHLSLMEMMCGGVDLDMLAEDLKKCVEDPTISGVVLYMNSPGGTVTGVAETAEMIKEMAKKKCIVAYADVMACSAAYWLMSACSAAYCAPSAEVGSIGVYSLLVDESRKLENEGIKVNAISAGKWKLAGAPFKPLTEEERQMFQEGVDKIYNAFKAAVKDNRGVKDDAMEGQVFDGEIAAEKNLVDGTANTLEEVLDIVEEVTKVLKS